MNVSVDGKTAATTTVSKLSWSDYTMSVPIAAGARTIGVSFANQYRIWWCARTLSIDKITVVAAAATTTSAPPPPSGDSTERLQSMLDRLTPGDTLTLDPLTYQHKGVLKVRVDGVRINGNGATLQATNDSTSAVQILANNVTVSNIKLTAPLTGPRYTTTEQHKLMISGDGVVVRDVAISGSAASGVFLYGAGDFTVERVTVVGTRADGVHMTNGSSFGQVNNVTTEATGDDGVAVVSYSGEQPCHDIVVDSPTVKGTTWGRGVTVVGGRNITYRNIAVSNTNAAGVYIASENETLSVDNVDVVGGTVTGANTNPQVVHGAVLVYNARAGQRVADASLSNLTISGTPSTAQRNVGIVVDAGSVSGIELSRFSLRNTSLRPLLTSPRVARGSYTATGWTLDGVAIAVP